MHPDNSFIDSRQVLVQEDLGHFSLIAIASAFRRIHPAEAHLKATIRNILQVSLKSMRHGLAVPHGFQGGIF